MRFRFCSWLLAGIFLARLVLAEQLPVQAYGIQDGLAGDSVTSILQDSRGYLWFGTTDGLSRFDGERFVSYGTADGLPHERVLDVLESRDGTYWVATQGGLARFVPDRQPDQRAFQRLPLGSVQPEPVYSLYEDHAGRLWVGAEGRLFLIEHREDGFGSREIRLDAMGAVGSVLAFAETPSGELWIGTRQGLVRRQPSGRLAHVPVEPHYGEDIVRDLGVDRDGRLWILHPLHTFVLWPGAPDASAGGSMPSLEEQSRARSCLIERTGTLPAAPGEVCQVGGRPDSGWQRIFASADDGVWLVSIQGLFRWDGALHSWTEDNGLTERSLTAVTEDRDGNLWLGTEGRGAMRVARHGFEGFTRRDGLGHEEVLSIFGGSDGRLYVHSGNTYEGQLWLQRLDGPRWTAVRPKLPPPVTYLGWSRRQSALLDRSGIWWIPTGQGLLRYPQGTPFERLASTPPRVYTVRDGLGSNSVERLFEDSRGDLWIGTNGDRAVARWSRATEKIETFGPADGVLPGLPSGIVEAPAGQVWIGFNGGGVIRLHDGRWQSFGLRQGLPPGPISDLFADRSGRLWVATEGGGVGRLDKPAAAAPRFARYTMAEGLSSNEVRCLVDDRAGRLYFGGHKGIDRFEPRTGRVEHFSTADGLASNRVDAAFRDRAGNLWFGTRQGLSRLDPVQELPVAIPPPWITAVQVYGAPQLIFDLGVPRAGTIELEASRSGLEIEFRALHLAPGVSLGYEHRMVGFDPKWSPVSPVRSVAYAHLPPGTFRFQVRTVAPESRLHSLEMAEVEVVVHPPVWRRAWFLVLVVLFVASGVYLLYRYRVSHLVAVERMRTRISTDLHDDLGSSLSRISILSELARRRAEHDPEEVRLVGEIGETAREMLEALGESIWAIDPRRDNLRSLVTRIRRFAGDLLEGQGIAWQLQAPADAEQVRLSPEERRHLYLIFKEALHNASRHSGATSVSLVINATSRRLTAVLRDDGKGFLAPQATESVGRHGLPSMIARAAQLKGELRIDSMPGKGTEIHLEVPLSGSNA